MKRFCWTVLLFSELILVLVVGRQGSELTVYKDVRPWGEAASICRQLGGDLVKMDHAMKSLLTRASKFVAWTSFTSSSNKIWLGLHNTTSCNKNVTTHSGTEGAVTDTCLVWSDCMMWDVSSDFGNWPKSSGLSSVDCVAMAGTGSLYWETEPCTALHHYMCENMKTGPGECLGASTAVSALTVDSCRLTCDGRDLCWGFKFKDPGICFVYDNDDPFACSVTASKSTSIVGIKNCFNLQYKSYTGAVGSDTLLNRDCDPPATGLTTVASMFISSHSESFAVIWGATSSDRLEENRQPTLVEIQGDQSLSVTNGHEFYPMRKSVIDPTDWSETRLLDVFTGDHPILHTSMATGWPSGWAFLASPGETTSLPADKTGSFAASPERSAAASYGLGPSSDTTAGISLALSLESAEGIVLDPPGIVLDPSLHAGATLELESSLNTSALLPGFGLLTSLSSLLLRSDGMRDEQSSGACYSSDEKSSLAFDPTASTKPFSRRTPLAVRLCPCDCRAFGRSPPLSREDYLERLADFGINASKLSSTRRKLHSAPDSRTSVKAIGYVGVAIVTLLFSLLVVPDAIQAVVYLKNWQRKTVP